MWRIRISSDVVVASALVEYRSLDKAPEVFDKMPKRDVLSWTTMIAGYV